MTYREARYVSARINGRNRYEAAKEAGFSEWLARVATVKIETDEMREQIAVLQQELVEHTITAGLIDASEIHEYLTDALRCRMSDIRNDDHSFKPRSEWPEIWDRLEEGGEVDVEYEKVRSHDGKDTEGIGGWETGGIVRKVKFKFASKVKLLELAMKHKGVDAMAVEKQSLDVNIHAEITAKLQSALKRQALMVGDVSATDIRETG